jgi:hypothetical protein
MKKKEDVNVEQLSGGLGGRVARMSPRVKMIGVTGLLVTEVLVVIGVMVVSAPRPVEATHCWLAWPPCGSSTRAASIEVSHPAQSQSGWDDRVEPDTTVSYTVESYYKDWSGVCAVTLEDIETVVVTVSGGSFSVTCSGCSGSDEIQGAAICAQDRCSDTASAMHGFAYTLRIDLAPMDVTTTSKKLYEVKFITDHSQMDAGDRLDDDDCDEVEALSAVQTSYSVSDFTFECGQVCDPDVSLQLLYE